MTAWLVAAAALILALVVSILAGRRRRKRLIESFAEARGLIHSAEDDGRLGRMLDYAFEVAAPCERIFDDIHDLATDGDVVLFRMTEHLDLGRRIQTSAGPLERIAVTFAVPSDIDLFFMVSRQLNVKNAHPDDRDPQSDVHFARLRQVLNEQPLPQPLSVTMIRGRALLYLLPRRQGALADEDLAFLFGLAKRLEGVFRKPTAAARRQGRA